MLGTTGIEAKHSLNKHSPGKLGTAIWPSACRQRRRSRTSMVLCTSTEVRPAAVPWEPRMSNTPATWCPTTAADPHAEELRPNMESAKSGSMTFVAIQKTWSQMPEDKSIKGYWPLRAATSCKATPGQLHFLDTNQVMTKSFRCVCLLLGPQGEPSGPSRRAASTDRSRQIHDYQNKPHIDSRPPKSQGRSRLEPTVAA